MNETKGNKSKGSEEGREVKREREKEKEKRKNGDQSGAVYPVFAGVR